MSIVRPYILIADDDPEDRQALTDELTNLNPDIKVMHVEDGHDLLRFLEECLPDQLPALLVLDYQMPDIMAPMILQHLAADQRYKKMVKVMWSTSRRTKDREECTRLGAVDYLVKPGSVDELRKATCHLTAIFEKASLPAP